MRIVPIAALVLLVALAGCADGGGGRAQEHDAAERTVTIDGFSYLPATITVQQGDTVLFRNTHSVQHSATLDSGERDTGPIAPGQTKQFTMPTAGRHLYHCAFHAQMTGTIVVNEA